MIPVTAEEIRDLARRIDQHLTPELVFHRRKRTAPNRYDDLARTGRRLFLREPLRSKDGLLIGLILAGPVDCFPRSGPVQGKHSLLILLDPKANTALPWAKRILTKNAKMLRTKSFVSILNSNVRPLLKPLMHCGVFVQSILLLGDVQQQSTKSPPFPRGYRARRLRASDIDPVLEIIRAEFKRNPKYGWFVATPAYLATARAELTEDLTRRTPHEYVVTQGSRVVGHFAIQTHSRRDPASVGIDLAREAQGIGLSTCIYGFIFQRLRVRRVRHFLGGTAHPAILHSARAMKRKVFRVLVKSREPYFPLAHFTRYPYWAK